MCNKNNKPLTRKFGDKKTTTTTTFSQQTRQNTNNPDRPTLIQQQILQLFRPKARVVGLHDNASHERHITTNRGKNLQTDNMQ